MWTSSLSICIVKKGQYSTYVYCSYTCIHTCIHSTGTYIHSTDTYIDACMSAYIDQYIHASLHLSIHSSTVGPKQWRWLSVPADSSRILFVSRWTQIACLEVSRFCLVKNQREINHRPYLILKSPSNIFQQNHLKQQVQNHEVFSLPAFSRHFLCAKCYRASHASSGVVFLSRLGVCLAAPLEAQLYRLKGVRMHQPSWKIRWMDEVFFWSIFLIHLGHNTCMYTYITQILYEFMTDENHV